MRVVDNSADADPKTGQKPRPVRVLSIEAGKVIYPLASEALRLTPDWARPIVMAAIKNSIAGT